MRNLPSCAVGIKNIQKYDISYFLLLGELLTDTDMSRAKAKCAVVHDLQSRQSDFILTKKDCDMICKGLAQTFPIEDVKDLYYAFKDLTQLV